MSASLVGSEMCIRDRPWPSPRAGPWLCGGRASGPGSRRTVLPGSLRPTPRGRRLSRPAKAWMT
eukprot:13089322-Alexandrium_andersonii.AAC.1